MQHSGTEATLETSGTLTVLSVSPNEEDHTSLETIMSHTRWRLVKAKSLPAGRMPQGVSVVLCECDSNPGTWIEVLNHIQAMPTAPSLIVTSRLADEQLWAAALNRGAWDVLAKPFESREVLHSVKSAWQHWYHQFQSPHQMRAAG